MLDLKSPILLVDNYSTMLRIMKNLLQSIGFNQLFEAANGEEALQILETEPIRLVLTDLYMDPVSGFDLLNEMQKKFTYKEIPVIIISADSSESVVQKARELGAANYLIKPFNLVSFRHKVVKALQKGG